ncbi:O-antigen polysaccharide polymerase Wzy family protein [Sellimonas catena]|nr:O-antigen polysaccharide polymerase Wzy family protein [Sellimonas catena]
MGKYYEKCDIEVKYMKNQILQVGNIILLIFSFILFSFGILMQEYVTIFWAIFFVWIVGVIYSVIKIRERIIVLCFFITLLTFLLGGSFLELILENSIETIFSNEITIHMSISLYLAVFGIILGCLFSNKVARIFKLEKKIKFRESDLKKYFQKSAKIITYFTLFFYFVVLFEKIFFVRDNTYLEYYLEYATNLPGVVVKLADMFPIAFWIFMGSMPSKKEVNRAMLFYGGYSVISLGTGQRNKFVLGILMIIIYYFFRDKMDHKQKWINKKVCFVGLLCVPFLISFLYFFGFSRDGIQVNHISTGEAIVEFMKNQSTSADLIGYEKLYETYLPENKLYSLGRLKDFFQNNVITQALFDIPVYQQQTAEAAIYGNSFGQMISYLVMPWNYIQGRGLGSCYIAELYHDFGYIGIFLFNLLLGIVLSNSIYIVKSGNMFVIGIFLLMVEKIIYMPRDTTSNFLYTGINFTTILTIVLIVIIGKMIQMKYKER